MNKIHILAISWFGITIFGCSTKDSNTEKYQNKRNNITSVKNRVQEIKLEGAMIGSIARIQLLGDYLVITDAKSIDMLVHLFNKSDYQFVTSAIPRGQGPGEITNIGYIAVNRDKDELYVSDHGKQKIFCLPVDSILKDPYYMPSIKTKIDNIQFPADYEYINDTLCFARIIAPTGNVGYDEIAAKWNMLTGEVKKLKYSHPKVKKKRIVLTASLSSKSLVECYRNQDLMTIMDLDGNLKCNIYGNKWNNGNDTQNHYFGKVFFRGNKIIAAYSGEDMHTDEYYPTKLLIFNINGDYTETLDIGYRIADLVYDEQNDRIVFNFEDIIQFGYLDMNDLIE